MDINDILNSCIHSEKKFFPQIIQMADYIVEGANLLTDMISMEDEKFKQEEIYNRIKMLETACDAIVERALKAGSRDNISAVIIYNDGEDAE